MTDFTLDMTMMFAIHDAFRRDLEQIAQSDSRTDGSDFFVRMLHMHHSAEDDLLWPVTRDAAAGRPDDLALLDEMEAEHAAMLPALDAVDRALANGEAEPEVKSELDTRLREHLSHEENAALPLIDRTLTEEQWMTFGRGSTEYVGADMPRFLPWVLDGADDEVTARLLGLLPEPVRQTYTDTWQPAYAAVDSWATKSSVT
jgi:hypothetical protein